MAQAEAQTRTLTFLFTDVEGSTKLWERYPEQMRRSLGLHDAIVREAIESAGGTVVKSMGDGFMAAFPSCLEGLTACVTSQLALAREEWPETGPLLVRMGIHTGEASSTGGDYFGPAVNRAARIMGAGHGGQILLSNTAAALVVDSLPDTWSLLDLGEHQLKGLGRAERIYQVVHPELVQKFPNLATVEGQANGLPTESSEFVGRTAELNQLRERLTSDATRIVTLTGPGGIGKTRLALRAASDVLPSFSDGATFVDLSAATDKASVLLATARAFGIPDRNEQEQLDGLVARLHDQQRLLVLDNFEQAIEAASAIATILAECPRVNVLVTSREALNVRGEHVFRVRPMALPDSGPGRPSAEQIEAFESVQLFVERAQAVRPDFLLTDENAAAVAEICRRLDGLPLAIELATARIGIFSPQKLLERLTSRLDLLKGGARDLPERQRTLRGTIEWSYDLLEPGERRLFALLSVFDGADFEAVEAVVDGLNGNVGPVDVVDGLVSLTNKSLLRQQELDDGGSRFNMLETVREYASGQLEIDRDFWSQAQQAHASYYADLAAAQAEHLGGPRREEALAALDVDRRNFAACWRYWVETGDSEHLDSLIDRLWPLYEARGWYRAMLEMGSDMLEILEDKPVTPERTRAEVTLRVSMARTLLAMEGFTPAVEEAYARAMALFADGEAPELFPVFRGLASFHLYRAEFEKAADLGRRILRLADAEGDDSMRLEGRLIVGANTAFMNDLHDGLKLLEEAISGFESHPYQAGRYRSGNDPRVAALTSSAVILWLVGRIDDSLGRVERALEIAGELHHPPSLAYARHHASVLHFMRAEPEMLRLRAAGVLEIAEAEDLEIWRAVGTCMLGAATVGEGQAEAGLAQIEHGMALYRGLKTPPVFWPMLLHVRAWACGRAGRASEGLAYVDEAIPLGGNAGPFAGELYVLRGDLLGDVGTPSTQPERIAAYELAYQIATDVGTTTPQLRAATRRVQVPAPGADEDALVQLLAQLYGSFTQGLDTGALVEAREVLVDRGALPSPSSVQS